MPEVDQGDIGPINIEVGEGEVVVKQEYSENVRVKQEPVVVQGARVVVQNKVGHSRMINEKRGWRLRRRSGELDEVPLNCNRVKEENLEDGGAIAGDVTGGDVGQHVEPLMAGLDVEEGEGDREVDTESKDEVKVTDQVGLVLVQHNSKYKWPGLIVGREGTHVRVKLFNKSGLKGRLTLVDQDAVTDFEYSDELDDVVKSSNNNELKNGFKKALSVLNKRS